MQGNNLLQGMESHTLLVRQTQRVWAAERRKQTGGSESRNYDMPGDSVVRGGGGEFSQSTECLRQSTKLSAHISIVAVTQDMNCERLKSQRKSGPAHEFGEGETCLYTLTQKPSREESTHRQRWENNIKMDLKGIRCEKVECFLMAHDMAQWRSLVNSVMNLRVP
jgi:uncharacterized protein YecT (DUF1311 family)